MRSYMICTSPRTGGNWLDRLLIDRGLGEPDEYLRYMLAHDECNEDGIRWTWDEHSPNEIFGIKVHWDEQYGLKFIDLLPPGPQLYIHLTRVDRDAQARSWALARQYQTWFTKPPPGSEPDPSTLEASRVEIKHMNGCWRAWFEMFDIEPLKITFEQLLMNEHVVVDRIAERLESFGPSPAPGARRRRRSGMRRHPIAA